MLHDMNENNVFALRDEAIYQRYRADMAEDAQDRLRQSLAEAEAELERIREALGGYPDSDLVSLAETIRRGYDAWEETMDAVSAGGAA